MLAKSEKIVLVSVLNTLPTVFPVFLYYVKDKSLFGSVGQITNNFFFLIV